MKSVDSTMHLTHAMGLVASSKIRRAMEAMHRSREYACALENVVALLSGAAECRKSPFLQDRGEDLCLIVIAGDRGLAGGYNANAFRLASTLSPKKVLPIGKRACERYGGEFLSSERITYREIYALCEKLCEEYEAGGFQRLGILHTKYHSMLSQEAVFTPILPITPKAPQGKADVLFEPDAPSLLRAAIADYVAGAVFAAIRESFACEVAARRTAMDSAGKNAQEMLGALQLQYNRARQGAITQEITEIVAGSGN